LFSNLLSHFQALVLTVSSFFLLNEIKKEQLQEAIPSGAAGRVPKKWKNHGREGHFSEA